MGITTIQKPTEAIDLSYLDSKDTNSPLELFFQEAAKLEGDPDQFDQSDFYNPQFDVMAHDYGFSQYPQYTSYADFRYLLVQSSVENWFGDITINGTSMSEKLLKDLTEIIYLNSRGVESVDLMLSSLRQALDRQSWDITETSLIMYSFIWTTVYRLESLYNKWISDGGDDFLPPNFNDVINSLIEDNDGFNIVRDTRSGANEGLYLLDKNAMLISASLFDGLDNITETEWDRRTSVFIHEFVHAYEDYLADGKSLLIDEEVDAYLIQTRSLMLLSGSEEAEKICREWDRKEKAQLEKLVSSKIDAEQIFFTQVAAIQDIYHPSRMDLYSTVYDMSRQDMETGKINPDQMKTFKCDYAFILSLMSFVSYLHKYILRERKGRSAYIEYLAFAEKTFKDQLAGREFDDFTDPLELKQCTDNFLLLCLMRMVARANEGNRAEAEQEMLQFLAVIEKYSIPFYQNDFMINHTGI